MKREIAQLNKRFKHHSATDVLTAVLRDRLIGNVVLVSSFGAESVALIHLSAMVSKDIPIVMIDTNYLFTETLVYQQEIIERLGLKNLRIISAQQDVLDAQDPYGALKFTNPDRCCHLRKTAPLQQVLKGYDGWITGRKRFQNQTRATLDFFEYDEAVGHVKINPLAHWTPQDVQTYLEENRLPKHPLVAQGYPSIGCAPCTSKVQNGEDPRSGRWRHFEKTECGLHVPHRKTEPLGDHS